MQQFTSKEKKKERKKKKKRRRAFNKTRHSQNAVTEKSSFPHRHGSLATAELLVM